MRLLSRQTTVQGLPGATGPLRADRRTASLLPRLRPGDIAVVDHLDLDRSTAQALVDAGVVAVVDASPLISGRYPNAGPEVLAAAGVAMLDQVGPGVFAAVHDGRPARVHDGVLVSGADPQAAPLATGRSLDAAAVTELMEQARGGLSSQLQSLTHNTTEFLRREQELLLHGRGIPETRTRLTGRPVVVVARGHGFREDLRGLRGYLREQHPVLVGVDAGSDALLEAGHRPDIALAGPHGLDPSGGPGTRVSDKALRSAREVVLHADASGHAAGRDRLQRLGIGHQTLVASGSSEDVALLLAEARGASMVVTVGAHASLEDFLDRERDGQASAFLTRLRVGPKLVDAASVPQLYAGRVRAWQLALVVLAALVALGVAIGSTPLGAQWWDDAQRALSDAGTLAGDLTDLVRGPLT